MDNIINIFKSTFLFKEDVDTDNLVFKIITKISVGICVSCALLVAATQGNNVYTKKNVFQKWQKLLCIFKMVLKICAHCT